MKKILVAASMVLLGTMGVQAAGTPANTDITNSVILSYDVGGVTQTTVPSNTDSFKVDRKIDLIVDATNTPLDVTPDAKDQNLSFVIVNEGNDDDHFTLSLTDNLGGDNFDPDNCQITDTSGNLISVTPTIAPDANITVYVSCDIPVVPNVHDDDNATVSLLATSSYGDDSATADNNTTVQNVWADGIGTDDDQANPDGKHSDRGTYHVVSADLSASKESCVVNDPINGTTNPKRIPGATVRYVIQVNNNGSADASNVTTTDGLQSELTYVTSYIEDGACNCAAPTGVTNADASTSYTDPNVTLNFATVSAATSECAYIEATIN